MRLGVTSAAVRRAVPVVRSRARDGHAALLRLLSPLGLALLVVGACAWAAATTLGWVELAVLAATLLVLVAVCVLLTVGRMSLRAQLTVAPGRVVAGERVIGEIDVHGGGSRLGRRAARVEVAVGEGAVSLDVPRSSDAETRREVFVITTDRRGVIPVGPARSVKGDPLGIARRSVDISPAVELFVHPVTVRLPGITSGWRRDLDGQELDQVTSSGVTFSALRDYAPGDDRRHVHWKTTARTGRMMVRQFVDVRRSDLSLLLSTDLDDYADGDEFELAVSVLGSFGKAAYAAGQQVRLTTGTTPLRSNSAQVLLDGLARVEAVAGTGGLQDLRRLRTQVLGSGLVVLAAGSRRSRGELRAAAARSTTEGRVLAVRVVRGGTCSLSMGAATVAEVATLSELPRLTARFLGG